MIALEKINTTKSSGIKDSIAFGIKDNGLAHIFNVLRSQLYSDKILAVMREYSTNAVDAHVESEKASVPIEVTLPNRFSPNFKVRDFGKGLSQDDVRNIYAFYGESTKRNSNLLVGQLGLGSKSAFAYSDNFVINSYVNGVKTTYNAFIDVTQIGQIAMLDSEPTNEPDGVEIVVPVKSDDFQHFLSKAKSLFRYFKVYPVIKGVPDFKNDLKSPPLLSGNLWEIENRNNESYGSSYSALAIMGNIAYPFEASSLKLSDENSTKLRSLMDRLLIEFEIGDLDIAASREKLQFSDRTIKKITDRLQEIRVEIDIKIQEKLSKCETLFEAKTFFGRLSDYNSPLRHLKPNKVLWQGTLITDTRIIFDHKDLAPLGKTFVKGYSKSWRGARMTSSNPQGIDGSGEKTVLVLNDINAKTKYLQKLRELVLVGGKNVTFFSDYTDAFFKKYELKPKDFILLSSLPAPAKTSVANVVSNVHNKKHSLGAFSYNGTKNYTNVCSSYWTSEDIDLKNDSGVYIQIEGFQGLINMPGMHNFCGHPINIASALESLKKLNINIPKIYGFKKDLMEDVKKNNKFIHINDYVANALQDYVKNNKSAIKICNRQHALENAEHWHKITKFKLQFDQKTMMRDALDKVHSSICEASRAELDTTLEVLKFFGVTINKVTPTHDIKVLNESIKKQYSLLQLVDWRNLDYLNRKSDINLLVEYVNKVEKIS